MRPCDGVCLSGGGSNPSMLPACLLRPPTRTEPAPLPSLSQAKRVNIGIALVSNPRVLFLGKLAARGPAAGVGAQEEEWACANCSACWRAGT